jgi:glycosyltransferase involved in cell wall biosynthesis
LTGVPHIGISGRSLAPWRFDVAMHDFAPGYRALLRRPGVVLSNNSVAGAHDYARWLRIEPGTIQILRNGVAARDPADDEVAALRAGLGIAADRPIIGAMGRLSSEKDPLTFIEAAAKLHRRHPALCVLHVGAGPLRDEMVARLRQHKLEGSYFLLGTRRDPEVILRSLAVFVLTSLHEGLPNVLIEAQQQGVPVVSTNAGGAGETFEPGVSGSLVPVGDVDAIVREVERWLAVRHNAELRASIAQTARERYAIQKMVARAREITGLDAQPRRGSKQDRAERDPV